MEIIADAGHFPHWEQADSFAQRVADFAARA
jgi:pimeloyl-ACP methyl ester carboxylesterase